MIICGLDPGLQRTGYGIIKVSRGALTLVDAGMITTHGQADLADRVLTLHREVSGVLEEHPDIEAVAVEDLYSHYRHPQTAVLMAHARGVMLLAARQRGINIVSVPATTVKKAVVGMGRASKVQVQRAVMIRLGITTERAIPIDVTDAIALAICCFEHLRTND